MCGYFNAVTGCTTKQGKSISPIGTTADGGKVLKVRWLRPGSGKSGGLRFGFVAYCDERRVVLVKSSMRRDADDDGAMLDAADDGDEYIDDFFGDE